MRKEDLLGVQRGAAARCWVSLTPSFASWSILGVLSKPHTNIPVKTALTGIAVPKGMARSTSVFPEGFMISCIWCLAKADGPIPKTISMNTWTEDHLLQKGLSPCPGVQGCSPAHCMHSHRLSPLYHPEVSWAGNKLLWMLLLCVGIRAAHHLGLTVYFCPAGSCSHTNLLACKGGSLTACYPLLLCEHTLVHKWETVFPIQWGRNAMPFLLVPPSFHVGVLNGRGQVD